MKKEKQPSFDLIRAVSTFVIVLFHFSYSFVEYSVQGNYIFIMLYANGTWGSVFVALFFMLSGASLIYNHEDMTLKDVPRFYFRRFLAIFPMFYIVWIIVYISNSRLLGTWHWGGPNKNYLLSLFGVDGYFMHHGMNYYCIGEWFLGAIIMIYLLFPLLKFLFMKFRIPSTILLTAVYIFNVYRHLLSSAPDKNLFIVLVKYYNSHITVPDARSLWTCIMAFWIGMLIITYRDILIKKWPALAALVVFLIMTFINLNLNDIFSATICATALYILFSFCSERILRIKAVRWLVNLISRYSYGIFLVHHVTIYYFMKRFCSITFNIPLSILVFVFVFAVIILLSIILTEFTNLLLRRVRTVPKSS
ncbi:MAG: acyltransferase [Lachnospiraceae bacterium]|nr:acyltransferase [Lachnospiraceae bacterium]